MSNFHNNYNILKESDTEEEDDENNEPVQPISIINLNEQELENFSITQYLIENQNIEIDNDGDIEMDNGEEVEMDNEQGGNNNLDIEMNNDDNNDDNNEDDEDEDEDWDYNEEMDYDEDEDDLSDDSDNIIDLDEYIEGLDNEEKRGKIRSMSLTNNKINILEEDITNDRLQILKDTNKFVDVIISYGVYREGLLYYYNDLYIVLISVDNNNIDYDLIFRNQIDIINISEIPNVFNNYIYRKNIDKYKSRIIKYNHESLFNCLPIELVDKIIDFSDLEVDIINFDTITDHKLIFDYFKVNDMPIEIYSDQIEELLLNISDDRNIIDIVQSNEINSIILNDYTIDGDNLIINSFYFVYNIDDYKYNKIVYKLTILIDNISVLYVTPLFDHKKIKTDLYEKYTINIDSVNFNNYQKKFNKLKRGDIVSLDLIDMDNDYNVGIYLYNRVDHMYLYLYLLDPDHYNYTPFIIQLYKIKKVNFIGMENKMDIMAKYRDKSSEFTLGYFINKFVNILLINYNKVTQYYISNINGEMVECHYYNEYSNETSTSMFIPIDHICSISLDYESNIMVFNKDKNKASCIIKKPNSFNEKIISYLTKKTKKYFNEHRGVDGPNLYDKQINFINIVFISELTGYHIIILYNYFFKIIIPIDQNGTISISQMYHETYDII